MPSEQYTKRELSERYLKILAQARAHFNSDKAQREPLRSWYEETYGDKYVPPQIIKNGYLQVPGQRGWYWLDPMLMNQQPVDDNRTEDETDQIDEATDKENEEAGFALEYQLRDFIAYNLGKIPVEGKRLRLYVDSNGRNGIEYPSEVGPIDILAVDDLGALFVFELKRSRSPDYTLGQLLRYMGWVRKKIATGEREVHGVIVARVITESLLCGALMIPKVSLFEYEIQFRLKPVQQLPQ